MGIIKNKAQILTKIFFHLLKDDRGQATTEYILILLATLTVSVTLVRSILKVLDQGVLRLGGQLEKDLKTGRAPTYVWSN